MWFLVFFVFFFQNGGFCFSERIGHLEPWALSLSNTASYRSPVICHWLRMMDWCPPPAGRHPALTRISNKWQLILKKRKKDGWMVVAFSSPSLIKAEGSLGLGSLLLLSALGDHEGGSSHSFLSVNPRTFTLGAAKWSSMSWWLPPEIGTYFLSTLKHD